MNNVSIRIAEPSLQAGQRPVFAKKEKQSRLDAWPVCLCLSLPRAASRPSIFEAYSATLKALLTVLLIVLLIPSQTYAMRPAAAVFDFGKIKDRLSANSSFRLVTVGNKRHIHQVPAANISNFAFFVRYELGVNINLIRPDNGEYADAVNRYSVLALGLLYQEQVWVIVEGAHRRIREQILDLFERFINDRHVLEGIIIIGELEERYARAINRLRNEITFAASA